MKEFIEKLISKLNEEKQINPCRNTQCKDCIYTNQCYEGEKSYRVGVDNIIKIVNKLAEEYNNDFCEWKIKSWGLFPINTSCENSLDVNYNYEFCPYCGKKIKVVE